MLPHVHHQYWIESRHVTRLTLSNDRLEPAVIDQIKNYFAATESSQPPVNPARVSPVTTAGQPRRMFQSRPVL